MKRLRPATLAALLIAIGAIRMATTFRIFSATNDEATHIGAGLELFQYHRYLLLRENPPLPRVILAAAPWFGGMRYDPRGTFTDQIHSVFYDHGEYRANLVHARAGTIVFFVIAAVALFFAAATRSAIPALWRPPFSSPWSRSSSATRPWPRTTGPRWPAWRWRYWRSDAGCAVPISNTR
jgi:hypothetical protein